ncbi:ABC transporter substrate-binding protein [Paenibacillus thalictri]|uniref:Sugar ABC transporter substrate-binding protein n=1 Tax=Paenibacillus thalictri TaxID=2527873 RepID=A0A4Q9DND7_9BACL|nr:sugar ABC transporter substrate-binding protein [Paenibacillus thalictri]TBL73963.1 sugar ABC transporter substrate-binding protein [Paenibacillus thalictri]
MKRNTLKLIACGTLSLSLLAGCSGGGGGSGDAAGTKGPVTLRFFTHGSDSLYNWTETIPAFEKKFPDIKIEMVLLSEKGDTAEAGKKLDLAAASGETMDILMIPDSAGFAQRVGLGMAAPMDDFIAKEGLNVKEEYKADLQFKGKYYALPTKLNPWYVVLNKDHLDQAGLPVPKDWTWDEFMDYAKKLTKGEGPNKRYGAFFHGPTGGGFLEYLKLALGNQPKNMEFLKADGSSNMDNPLFRKTLEIFMKMEKEDKSLTPYADRISQKLAYRPAFFNQNASMILMGSWFTAELGGTDQFPLNFNVAVAPYPKNAPGDPSGYAPFITDYMVVAASSKHKEEAYKFIRWYTTEGQIVQGKQIPAWSKVKPEEMDQIIDKIISKTKSPEKVDKDSIKRVMAGFKSGEQVPPVAFQAELAKAINEEFEQLIFGKQDIDTTLKKWQERVQKLIDTNKK